MIEKYVIKVNNHYVKHTVNFGCFHGRIVLTKNIRESKMYTRKKDAIYKASIVTWRYRQLNYVKERFEKIYKIDNLPKVKVISYIL